MCVYDIDQFIDWKAPCHSWSFNFNHERKSYLNERLAVVVKSVIEALPELFDMVMASEPMIDAFSWNIQFTVWIQLPTRFYDVIPDGRLACIDDISF